MNMIDENAASQTEVVPNRTRVCKAQFFTAECLFGNLIQNFAMSLQTSKSTLALLSPYNSAISSAVEPQCYATVLIGNW